jgi:hypothetical protein
VDKTAFLGKAAESDGCELSKQPRKRTRRRIYPPPPPQKNQKNGDFTSCGSRIGLDRGRPIFPLVTDQGSSMGKYAGDAEGIRFDPLPRETAVVWRFRVLAVVCRGNCGDGAKSKRVRLV